MPSTEYFGYSVVNLGPLTTTWTASAACATKSDYIGFDSRITYQSPQPISQHDMNIGKASCETATHGECFPSGDGLDKVEAMESGLFYYSPAFVCPDGWTAAGTYKKGPEPTANGVFDPENHVVNLSGDGYQEFAYIHLYENILDENETLQYCCPSGFNAEAYYGGCTSVLDPLSSFSYSTWCQVFRSATENPMSFVTSFDGKTWDPPLASLSYPPGAVETVTGPLSTHPTEDVYVATRTAGVPIIYKQSDINGGGENSEQPVDEQPVEEQPVEEEPVEEPPVEEQPVDKQPVDKKPTGEQPTNAQPTDAQPVEEQPVNEQPVNEKPTDAKPTYEKPADAKPTGAKPSDYEEASHGKDEKQTKSTKSAEPSKGPDVETVETSGSGGRKMQLLLALLPVIAVVAQY